MLSLTVVNGPLALLNHKRDPRTALLARLFAANIVLIVGGGAVLALTPLTVGWPLARAEGAELAIWALVLILIEFFVLRAVLLRRSTRGSRGPDPGAELTARELEIVRLIAESYTAREIGEILCISPKTVNAHRENILKKLAVRDRVALIRYAIRRGWIQA